MFQRTVKAYSVKEKEPKKTKPFKYILTDLCIIYSRIHIKKTYSKKILKYLVIQVCCMRRKWRKAGIDYNNYKRDIDFVL